MLPVATDRLSIFDFVLPILVPHKGEILTALTRFWLMKILAGFPNHLESSKKDSKLNAVHDLKSKFPIIPLERCLAVKKSEIPPFEMIFRHHIGGSVYEKYLETSTAGGHKLPPGLTKWSYLKKPIFTPSTKEEHGHDINIDAAFYLEQNGKRGEKAIGMFRRAYSRTYAYACTRGILILDTKFEGIDVISDEVLTPDSSRFTTSEDFQKAIEEERDPAFYDKQPVREWGVTVKTPFGRGINKLDPRNTDHLSFVSHLDIPEDVVIATTNRYIDIFRCLVGCTLHDYQRNVMYVGGKR